MSQIPYVLIWHKKLRKGFLLDKDYNLMQDEVDNTDIIVSSSVVEDYHFFPGFFHQIPKWADDYLVLNTELVFPLNRADWIAYFYL